MCLHFIAIQQNKSEFNECRQKLNLFSHDVAHAANGGEQRKTVGLLHHCTPADALNGNLHDIT